MPSNIPLTPHQLIAQHSIVVLAPDIFLSLFALAVLLSAGFFSERVQRTALPMLTLIGTLMAAVATYALWDTNAVFGPRENSIYSADNFALFFKWIFLLGLAVSTLLSSRFLHARTGDRHSVAGEFYALMILSTIGMMMVGSARDLLVIFLGIETLSIALYILAGFARARAMSNEAALKYFLLGAFATGFLLYGIALTYFAVGSTLLPTIARSVQQGQNIAGAPISSGLLYLGLALMLIGLGFKAALVPFHQWTPDVYEGSPTPVTAFMAVGAKAAAFAAIMRVFPGAFVAANVEPLWYGIVLVMAVLTMTVGNVVAISQTSLKRMLAYSSVAHAGYLLMGVLATGRAKAALLAQPNSADYLQTLRDASGGVLFYLAIYALMNLGAFATLVYLENARAAEHSTDANDTEDGNIKIADLRGLAYRNPLAAAALTIFLLSLAGIPPTAGFFGKLYIFESVVRQGAIGLAVVGALNTVISVYYYLCPIVEMSARDEVTAGDVSVGSVNAGGAVAARPAMAAVSPAVGLAIGICVFAVLAMIVAQSVALPWAQSAASALTEANVPSLPLAP